MHRGPRLNQSAPRSARARRALALLLVGLPLGLAGCAGSVTVEPAPEATDPACAEVLVRLPDAIGERGRVQTTSQSSAAWGAGDDLVVLRCGVEPLGPTTDPCVGVGAVDWVTSRPDGEPVRTTYTTYGRSPAVEVTLRGEEPTGVDVVLSELGGAVEVVPADRTCS